MSTTYSILVLNQTLVVTRQCNHKEQALHALKTVDPFFPLGTLPTNVHHAEIHLPKLE
jgi:hypothetical protein